MKVTKNGFVKILFIVYTIGFTFGGYLMWEYSSEFQKHEEHYNSIITGIGFILGLIVVVTIFYLGKSHDYYKSILEISNKNKIDFDSYMNSFDIAEAEFEELGEISKKFFKSIKEHNRENIEEFEVFYEKQKKRMEKKPMNLKKIEDMLKYEEEQKVNFSKYSKEVIIDFLKHTIPFVISFLLFIWFLEDPTVGKFYFLIIQMIISIINFFVYWFSSNERINDILEDYDSMLNLSRIMNKAELKERNHVQYYEEFKNIFLKINEKLDKKNQI